MQPSGAQPTAQVGGQLPLSTSSNDAVSKGAPATPPAVRSAPSTATETAVLIPPPHAAAAAADGADRHPSSLLTAEGGPGGSGASPELEATYRQITRHLMPLFLAVMVLNHVDRTNLAFASLTMNRDLGFGPAVYGLGSALFFLPFCIFQVPSNLAMLRVGVRRWLALLLFCWGVIASCGALIHDVPSFFTLRVLLGVFEAGAVPAMWYHLAMFYPPERITKPFTFLTIGVLVAQAVGGPVAAGFLAMNGLGGLRGWQWLFLLEGLPTVLLAVVVWFCLPDSPSTAKWLSEGQRKLHQADMARTTSAIIARSPAVEALHLEQLAKPGQSPLKLIAFTLRNPFFWYMCGLGVLLAAAAQTYLFFLPMIINALVSGKQQLAAPGAAAPPGAKGGAQALALLPVILTAVPYTVGAVAAFGVAHSSQRRQELFYHTALPAMIGGAFFVAFPFLARVSVAAGFVALVMVALTGASSIGPKTAIVHSITVGPAQAVAMPLYNSIVVIGGFFGPFVTGMIVQRTGNFTLISVLFGLCLIVCALGIIALKFMLAAAERRRARLAVARAHSHPDIGAGLPQPAPAAAAAAAAAADGSGGAAAYPESAGKGSAGDSVVVVQQQQQHGARARHGATRS